MRNYDREDKKRAIEHAFDVVRRERFIMGRRLVNTVLLELPTNTFVQYRLRVPGADAAFTAIRDLALERCDEFSTGMFARPDANRCRRWYSLKGYEPAAR